MIACQRRLSGLARAELTQHGYAVFGHEPTAVWATMSPDDVRRAAVEELRGYWTWAVRRPWWWLSTDQVDLAVTTMMRAHHTLATGQLITKSAALTRRTPDAVPRRLIAAVHARRTGSGNVGSRDARSRPALDAASAWRMIRRTIAASKASTGVISRG